MPDYERNTISGTSFGPREVKPNVLIVNKNIRQLTLATGIFLAAFGITQASGVSVEVDRENNESIESLYMDLYEVVLSEDHENKKAAEFCCQIYNANNELVYKSKDKDDPRLRQLLRRSDLLMKTNSYSYYLLGD
jgi:hypothetical protein